MAGLAPDSASCPRLEPAEGLLPVAGVEINEVVSFADQPHQPPRAGLLRPQLKARCDEVVATQIVAMETVRKLVLDLGQARTENVALQAVCAVLLAEVVVMYPDPKTKIGTITAGLLGLSEGVATAMGQDAQALMPAMSAVIDRITAMAEVLLSPPR